MAPCPQSLLARPMAAPRERGWGRLEVPGAPAPRPRPAPSPFQCRDAFVPAGGPSSGEAGSGLPRAIPVPGLLLPLPPALGVPAIVRRCPRGERGDLKAVIKDAEGKLPVPLRQREEVLVHVLRGEGHDRGPRRGPQAPPHAAAAPGSGLQGCRGAGGEFGGSRVRRTACALGAGPWAAATHLEGLPALVRGRCGGGGAVLCAPARTEDRASQRPPPPPAAQTTSTSHPGLQATARAQPCHGRPGSAETVQHPPQAS